ncbi:uncharacterized protein LOC107621029 [Arachis ipaensis]|nr:uncharacterized protein LOC107621029 [Arachis ipaensis]
MSFGFTAILVYMDDLVLAGDDLSKIESVKGVLHDRFWIKDMGDLKYFLGLEVTRSKTGISLYRRKYVLDLLKKIVFEGCKLVTTPMDYVEKLSNGIGELLTDSSQYRRIKGMLLYLLNTRPDISYAIEKLRQFLDCATNEHLKAMHRLVRYIKSSRATGLFFSADSNLHLIGFSDSDWVCCVDSRRSISAYCFYRGPSLVTWKSKKQLTVAASSS